VAEIWLSKLRQVKILTAIWFGTKICQYLTIDMPNLCKIWTNDRRARHGLQAQPECFLCDQANKSIDHILTTCLFTREIWFLILSSLANSHHRCSRQSLHGGGASGPCGMGRRGRAQTHCSSSSLGISGRSGMRVAFGRPRSPYSNYWL